MLTHSFLKSKVARVGLNRAEVNFELFMQPLLLLPLKIVRLLPFQVSCSAKSTLHL